MEILRVLTRCLVIQDAKRTWASKKVARFKPACEHPMLPVHRIVRMRHPTAFPGFAF
jgi:hypothetical protein